MITSELHVIGLMHPAIDSRDLQRLARIEFYFGAVGFIHRFWDGRARDEIVPGDVALFCKYGPEEEPTPFTFDDSAQQ